MYASKTTFFFSYSIIDFYIVIFFILNTFHNTILLYDYSHPPLFNVVFFIYLYAVYLVFSQQILIFFWFSPRTKTKTKKLFEKKNSLTFYILPKYFLHWNINSNHCDFVITSWHLIGSMIPTSWLLLSIPPAFFATIPTIFSAFFKNKVFFFNLKKKCTFSANSCISSTN